MLNVQLKLSRFLLLSFVLMLFFILFILINHEEVKAGDVWQDLRIDGREITGFASDTEESIIEALQDILSIFQTTPHLNPPPTDVTQISPRIRIFKRPEFSYEQGNLLRANLELPMWFAGQGVPSHTGRVDISVNEPEALLGKPALIDDAGGIYILPPVIEELESGPLYCKDAHPPGYAEEYPSRSFSPLWNPTVEPVLYSVVYPLFRLSRLVGVATELTADGSPFWEPVSQERWIRALQKYCQSELDFHLEAMQAEREQEVGWTEKQVENMRREAENMRELFSAEGTIQMNEDLISNYEYLIEMLKHQLDNPGFFQLDAEQKRNYKEQIEEYEQEIEMLNASLEERIIANQEIAEEWTEYMEAITRAVILQKDLLEDIEKLILEEKWDEMEEMAKEYEIDHLLLQAKAGKAIGYLETELQQMSSADRAAPAYGFDIPGLAPHMLKHIVPLSHEAERPSGLVSPDQEGARAVVAIKPGFFEEQLAEDTIKLIVVEWWENTSAMFFSPGASRYSEARVTMRKNLWQSLDWESIIQKIR